MRLGFTWSYLVSGSCNLSLVHIWCDRSWPLGIERGRDQEFYGCTVDSTWDYMVLRRKAFAVHRVEHQQDPMRSRGRVRVDHNKYAYKDKTSSRVES